MPVFPGTNIPTGLGSCDRMKYLVDRLLTPRLMGFRQICFFDLPLRLCPDKETWKAPFGNWLAGYCHEVNFSGLTLEVTDPGITDFDPVAGSFKITSLEMGLDGRPRDVVEASFQFDYFPIDVLEGFLMAAIEMINAGASGPPTGYKICGGTAPPSYWDGVITDMAFAMCMEKLLLDYNLWKYRLVFAVGPNEVESGGGDIVGQLETLKANAEERAGRALDNEKFKIGGNYTAPPTSIYFDAVRGFGGTAGAHGIPFSSGRLRGWKPNKWPVG